RGLENETRCRALTRLCQPAAASQPCLFHERRSGLSFRYAVLSIAALASSQPAVAGDSPFGYVYTTDTHPRGQRELEQWVTRRHGQSRGSSAQSSSTALPTTCRRRCTSTTTASMPSATARTAAPVPAPSCLTASIP